MNLDKRNSQRTFIIYFKLCRFCNMCNKFIYVDVEEIAIHSEKKKQRHNLYGNNSVLDGKCIVLRKSSLVMSDNERIGLLPNSKQNKELSRRRRSSQAYYTKVADTSAIKSNYKPKVMDFFKQTLDNKYAIRNSPHPDQSSKLSNL